MQRKQGRPPARDQVGKPKTRPWLEPPIELATTDVVSIPPDAPSDAAAPQKATPSWSNFEIVSSAKILAPPRLPEFRDPASSGTKAIAWNRVSARVMAVASARTTWVVAGAATILAAG